MLHIIYCGYSSEVPRRDMLPICKNIHVHCEYLLDMPCRGISNKYPQHICICMWKNEKTISTFCSKNAFNINSCDGAYILLTILLDFYVELCSGPGCSKRR